jgi:hypothetical protein
LGYVVPDATQIKWSEETRDPLPVTSENADGEPMVINITHADVNSTEAAAWLALTRDFALGGRKNFLPNVTARVCLRFAGELTLDRLPQVV